MNADNGRRVIGLGLVMADVLVRCSDWPRPETDRRIGNLELRPGGSTSNVLAGLRRLGHPAALVSAVGGDWLGRFLLSELSGAGIDHRYVVTSAGQSATCLIIETSGTRTLYWHLPEALEAAVRLDASTAADLVADAAAVHVNGRFPVAAAMLCQAARAVGRVVSLNIGRGDVAHEAGRLVQYADVLICPEEWALARTGADSAARACQQLSACGGPQVVSVTGGSSGSWTAQSGGAPVHTPADVRDCGFAGTAGAGDAYHAGFLAEHLSGSSAAAAARRGAAEAARHCASQVGGDSTVPAWRQTAPRRMEYAK